MLEAQSSFAIAAVILAVLGVVAYRAYARAARAAVDKLRIELHQEQDSVKAELAAVQAQLESAAVAGTPLSAGAPLGTQRTAYLNPAAISLAEVMDELASVQQSDPLVQGAAVDRLPIAEELAADRAEAAWLEMQISSTAAYDDLSDTQLDIRLLELIALALRADSLAEKYLSPSADRVPPSGPTTPRPHDALARMRASSNSGELLEPAGA